MPSKTITVTNGDGSTKTITIPDRSRFAGIRTMSRVTDGVSQDITVDRTAQVVTSDRKGESRPLLTKVVGGASAAYSLRDLNDKAGNNKVVRVRRKSDNSEKDFLAKKVKDIEAWVNAQIVPPLDVRELVDGERTGALIPAAAAYSLRNLSSTYTGNVVDVRRSSDNAEESFTAAEVADGTLEDWVTEEQVGWNVQPTWDVSAGDGVISSQSSTSTTSTFSITTTSGGSFVRQTSKPHHVIASSGDQVVANITVSGFNYGFNAKMRTSGTNTNVATAALTNGTADYTFNLTGSAGYFAFTGVEATSGATLTVNSIKVIGQSGFVSKWYDQSGNTKHATQAVDASQPKIVSGGSLVSGGLEFDGDRLNLTGEINTSSSHSLFGVARTSTTSSGGGSNYPQFLADNTSGKGFGFFANGLLDKSAGSNNSSGLFTFTSNTLEKLLSVTSDNSNITAFQNGVASSSNPIADLSSSNKFDRLGGSEQTSKYFDGTIQEIIIYNSDQSANRTAFEANIGETYGIDLPSGVDTGYDQVDGFVETWYDQSGNGNDATQSVAGNQPKIVSGGVFLGQVDFLNGVSTFLETNNHNLANLPELSLFSVLEPVTASANEFAISAGSIVNSTGNYGGWALWVNGYFDRLDFTTQAKGSGTRTQARGNITSTSPVVYSATLNGTNAQAAVNGVLGTENTSMITPYNGNATRRKLRLGCQYTFTPASFYRGAMKEVILYASDQTANREGIEANINNQYDIY